MAYVVDRYDVPSRSVWLRDDWNSGDQKLLWVNDWTGYESEIDIKIEENVAVVTLAGGTVKYFDLSVPGNTATEL